MSNRLYHDPHINIENVATELEHMFINQGYQVQRLGNNDQIAVQMKRVEISSQSSACRQP